MAIVDATRELEPTPERGIGWGGRTLNGMLEESERMFERTGS